MNDTTLGAPLMIVCVEQANVFETVSHFDGSGGKGREGGGPGGGGSDLTPTGISQRSCCCVLDRFGC